MPVSMHWHNAEKDILFVHYEDYTVAEHYQAVTDAKAMMDTVAHDRVDIINHLGGNIRPLMESSQHGSNILSNPHPRLGVIVIVYTNRLMLPLITLGVKLDARTRKTYRIAASVQQAEKIIAAERAQ